MDGGFCDDSPYLIDFPIFAFQTELQRQPLGSGFRRPEADDQLLQGDLRFGKHKWAGISTSKR